MMPIFEKTKSGHVQDSSSTEKCNVRHKLERQMGITRRDADTQIGRDRHKGWDTANPLPGR